MSRRRGRGRLECFWRPSGPQTRGSGAWPGRVCDCLCSSCLHSALANLQLFSCHVKKPFVPPSSQAFVLRLRPERPVSNTCLRRRRPREAPPAPAATFCTDNTGGGAVAMHRQKPGMQAKALCAARTKQPGREESLTSALPPILGRETEAWGSNACRAQGLERRPLERPGLRTGSTLSRPQFFYLSHRDNGNRRGLSVPCLHFLSFVHPVRP